MLDTDGLTFGIGLPVRTDRLTFGTGLHVGYGSTNVWDRLACWIRIDSRLGQACMLDTDRLRFGKSIPGLGNITTGLSPSSIRILLGPANVVDRLAC